MESRLCRAAFHDDQLVNEGLNFSAALVIKRNDLYVVHVRKCI